MFPLNRSCIFIWGGRSCGCHCQEHDTKIRNAMPLNPTAEERRFLGPTMCLPAYPDWIPIDGWESAHFWTLLPPLPTVVLFWFTSSGCSIRTSLGGLQSTFLLHPPQNLQVKSLTCPFDWVVRWLTISSFALTMAYWVVMGLDGLDFFSIRRLSVRWLTNSIRWLTIPIFAVEIFTFSVKTWLPSSRTSAVRRRCRCTPPLKRRWAAARSGEVWRGQGWKKMSFPSPKRLA